MAPSQLDLFWSIYEGASEAKKAEVSPAKAELSSASKISSTISEIRAGLIPALNETLEQVVVPEDEAVAQKKFEQALSLYERAFPLEERRSRASLIESLRRPDCKMYSVMWANEAAAFIIAWDLKVGEKEFVFVEHMAVNSKVRSRGYGSAVLNRIAGGKDLMLEVEPPDYVEGSARTKRIRFYGRKLKLHLNNQFDYVQPPYDEGGRYVPLALMSRPPIADRAQFEQYAKVIYETVYGLKDGKLPLDGLPLFDSG